MSAADSWQNLCSAIESVWPASRYRDIGVVVGCSGGADSVALLTALSELAAAGSSEAPERGFLIAAHFNHGFRGQESDADAEFVRELADSLGVKCQIYRGQSTRADEASARDQRRSFFADLMRREGCRYLALAHSLDDNVETFLFRLLRGTGPIGLAGIDRFRSLGDDPQTSDFVVARPMLQLRRAEIREALRYRGIAWREDSSNRSSQYHRNWIRNQVIPMIQGEFPHVVPAIGRTIEGQREWEIVLRAAADRWLEKFHIRDNPLTFCRLDRVGLAADDGDRLHSQAVAIEAFRKCWHRKRWPLMPMDQVRWTRLFEMLNGLGPDSINLAGKISVTRDDVSVTLTRDGSVAAGRPMSG